MSDAPISPTCDYRCPEKRGTCFPGPCKVYAARPKLPALEAARWRLQQCRKTVREGEEELVKRRAALEQAEIALKEIQESEHV